MRVLRLDLAVGVNPTGHDRAEETNRTGGGSSLAPVDLVHRCGGVDGRRSGFSGDGLLGGLAIGGFGRHSNSPAGVNIELNNKGSYICSSY
jgi:hypothetical protein